MALIIPGLSQRVRDLWLGEQARRGGIALNAFVKEHRELGQQNFARWTDAHHPTQPDYAGLEILSRVFGVSVAWLLVGEAVSAAERDLLPSAAPGAQEDAMIQRPWRQIRTLYARRDKANPEWVRQWRMLTDLLDQISPDTPAGPKASQTRARVAMVDKKRARGRAKQAAASGNEEAS